MGILPRIPLINGLCTRMPGLFSTVRQKANAA
jgi:hypothetical protein